MIQLRALGNKSSQVMSHGKTSLSDSQVNSWTALVITYITSPHQNTCLWHTWGRLYYIHSFICICFLYLVFTWVNTYTTTAYHSHEDLALILLPCKALMPHLPVLSTCRYQIISVSKCQCVYPFHGSSVDVDALSASDVTMGWLTEPIWWLNVDEYSPCHESLHLWWSMNNLTIKLQSSEVFSSTT